MKRESLREAVVAAMLIILLILLVNPAMFWMPSDATMLILTATVAAFGVFVGLVWREKARDEREQMHILSADRYGYLAGMTVLIIGIVAQSLGHSLSPWLPLVLTVMIVARLIGLVRNGITH